MYKTEGDFPYGDYHLVNDTEITQIIPQLQTSRRYKGKGKVDFYESA